MSLSYIQYSIDLFGGFAGDFIVGEGFGGDGFDRRLQLCEAGKVHVGVLLLVVFLANLVGGEWVVGAGRAVSDGEVF